MTVVPDEYVHLLEAPLFGHLATVRPDGAAQVNPMWYGWDGEFIRFTHATTRQKYRNIGHEPRVSMSILDPEDPYQYLEVRGEVVSIEADPEARFYVELSKRYGDEWPPPPDAADWVVITVRPTAVHSR